MNIKVSVTDDQGVVLDLFDVELEDVDPTTAAPQVARMAVLDLAESIRFGIA